MAATNGTEDTNSSLLAHAAIIDPVVISPADEFVLQEDDIFDMQDAILLSFEHLPFPETGGSSAQMGDTKYRETLSARYQARAHRKVLDELEIAAVLQTSLVEAEATE